MVVLYLFLGAWIASVWKRKMVTDTILKKEKILTHLVHYILAPKLHFCSTQEYDCSLFH